MEASTKDTLEVIYWGVGTLILCATVFYIYYGPIKAVKIGRLLDNEKDKRDIKFELFLTLFAYRGSPVHTEFVIALNQIDIVFQDVPPVLTAWHKLYDSYGENISTDRYRTWELLKIELLSAMAVSLGYQKLKEVDIMKHYSPVGHQEQANDDYEFRASAKQFFQRGDLLYSILIAQAQAKSPQTATTEEPLGTTGSSGL